MTATVVTTSAALSKKKKEYPGVRRPVSAPATRTRCGFLDSSVFSLALLSQSLPSRVSPFYTRRSALRLARCSKVPVIGSLSGSRLDSPSRPLTVPLLAPFLLAAGVSPCAAFFPGLAVLADASAAFAIVSHPNSIQIFFTTLCRVLRFVFQQSPTCANTSQLNLYRNASGPVVSHACSRRCHH